MLVLNLPFKALMFLTLMRPSLVLFLVLWLKLVKDFLKVRCRLALLPFLISYGTMFTLALVRFPPTATKEIQYLNAKGALTYTDIAGDPVLYGNLPPREISMKDVFRSGDSSKKFKI